MMEDNVIQTAHTQNIGLLNLNSRLKILYNNASRLIIRSNENEGTTVLLSIPLEGADTDA
jgi:sensor histidine kinase YesM